MFKPLLTSAATWPIERLINRVLQTDQHAINTLKRLSGKQIEINTASPAVNLCVIFANSEIRLSPFSSEELVTTSDAKISSDVSTLLGLLGASTEARPLANPRLKISGDAQLVQTAFNLLKSLDLRWDDLLAPFLGNATTHSLKTSLDDFQKWSEESADALRHNVDDYLKQEANILPTSNSLEEFQERLDRLRLRIDRAAARAERLLRLADAG